MPSNVQITDKDKGYAALFKRLEGKALSLSVGVLSEQEGISDGGITVGEVAAINEFGLGVPERSFIRAWADENEANNLETLRLIGRGVIEGKIDQATGLNQAGAKFAASIKGRIVGGIAPPNASSTEARKGSTTPLIDTGILLSAITWRVE